MSVLKPLRSLIFRLSLSLTGCLALTGYAAAGPSNCGCSSGYYGGCASGAAPGMEGMESGQLPGDDLRINETFAALTGSDFAVSDLANDGGGYIDYAVVGNFLRFRGDAAYNMPIPDRGEFFFAQGGFLGNPDGPPLAETDVDYQEFSTYLELALTQRFSAFIEAPIRAIDPEVNANHAGFSDLISGFKYALVACPEKYITFQFKVYAPTGDADAGLGTGHASLEPGVLYYQRWSDRITLYGEFRDWIPLSENEIDGVAYAGNTLRYGSGIGYDIINYSSRSDSERLTLLSEFVAWTVLDGQGFDTNGIGLFDAEGETIVNGKFGLRYSLDGHSFYAGYAHALSGDTWYEDFMRFEYRFGF